MLNVFQRRALLNLIIGGSACAGILILAVHDPASAFGLILGLMLAISILILLWQTDPRFSSADAQSHYKALLQKARPLTIPALLPGLMVLLLGLLIPRLWPARLFGTALLVPWISLIFVISRGARRPM
jgi:type IV secretory pathway TrbD component